MFALCHLYFIRQIFVYSFRIFQRDFFLKRWNFRGGFMKRLSSDFVLLVHYGHCHGADRGVRRPMTANSRHSAQNALQRSNSPTSCPIENSTLDIFFGAARFLFDLLCPHSNYLSTLFHTSFLFIYIS